MLYLFGMWENGSRGDVDLEVWDRSFREHFSLVAVEKEEVIKL